MGLTALLEPQFNDCKQRRSWMHHNDITYVSILERRVKSNAPVTKNQLKKLHRIHRTITQLVEAKALKEYQCSCY